MKTKVEITNDVHQCRLNKGDRGYIDGYVRTIDNWGYAVVVVGDKVDIVPLHSLRVIKWYYFMFEF